LRGYQEEYGPENCKSQEVADLLTALKARKHLEYLVIDHKLSEVETSEHIFRAYEKCDLIITTRFHGVILSLKSKKPFLAIDQIIDSKGKLRKLIETLKWPYVFYGESITIEDVEKAIDELLLEKDIESQLEQVSINEGKRSSLTLEELEEIIDSDDNAIKEVIVAGMHRSGTSMVGNLLKNMGFNMGLEKDLMPGNHYNLFGYFEHLEAVEINNDILNHYGASWIDVGPFVKNYHANDIDKVLKFADEKGGVRLTIGERINHLLRKLRKGGKDFAIKDPRFCLTLSFWLPFLHSPRLLICIRHPSEVALSIFKRDRYPQNVVNEVWVTYYAFLSKAMARSEIESPYLLINFSDLKNEREKIIGVLGAFLGIAFKKEKLANTIKQDLISVSLDSINTAKDSNFFALKLFEQMVREGKIPKIPLVEKFSNIHPTIYLKVGEKVYRARRQGSRYEVMVAFNSKLSFISFPLVIRDIRMDHSRLEIWPSCYVSGDKYLFKWHNDELNISTNDQSIKENDRVTLSFDLIGIYEELLHGIDYTAFSREFMFSQLFWKKEEEEFNEHRSKKWVVSNQRVVINIGQFIQDEGTSIRVDPVNDFVILQVENRKDIPEVILKEIGRFASSFELEEGIFYFLTDDPWFIIDAAELAIVEELILNIKFLRLGKVAVMESYHHHLNQLNKHLDELNRRLDLYENRLQERDQQLQERDQQLQERDQQLQERDQQLAIQLSEVQILKEHNKNLLEEKKALKNSISFRFGQLIVKPLSIFLKKS
jgi:hypothetical protein